MSLENRIELSKTTRIVLFLLTFSCIPICWTFYYFDKNDKRAENRVDTQAESPQEAIDFKERKFFVFSYKKTDENGKAKNDSYCNKICPPNYIMSVDCEYCFMFGQWRSEYGQKELLTGIVWKCKNLKAYLQGILILAYFGAQKVTKEYAAKFCRMHSGGWLPYRRQDVSRIWQNPIFETEFSPRLGNPWPLAQIWFGGSWDVASKRYKSDYDNETILDVFHNFPYSGDFRKSRFTNCHTLYCMGHSMYCMGHS